MRTTWILRLSGLCCMAGGAGLVTLFVSQAAASEMAATPDRCRELGQARRRRRWPRSHSWSRPRWDCSSVPAVECRSVRCRRGALCHSWCPVRCRRRGFGWEDGR